VFDYLHTTFFGTFQRMVFWELLRVFLLSLTGLTAMFVVAGVIQQANQFGLSLSQILTVIPLTVPTSLPYTIPATTLFASCVAYGRMSHDNEAVVLKAAGVDLYSLLRPALILGMLSAVATAAISYQVIPSCWRQIQEEAIRDPEETLYNILRREKMFKSTNSQWVLYVRDVQGRRLIDVVLKQKKKKETPEGGYDLVARARQAKLRVDTENNLLEVRDDESDNAWTVIGGVSSELVSRNNKPQSVPLPNEFQKEKLREQIKGRSQSIDWPDLPEKSAGWLTGPAAAAQNLREAVLSVPKLATLDAKGLLAVDAEFGLPSVPVLDDKGKPVLLPDGSPLLTPSGRVSPDPNQRPQQAAHYQDVARFAERTARTLQLEWYMRPALAFGCIVFALIGCPVGMWANRGDYLSIFVVCFLPTLFSYYPLLLSGAGLARDGKVPMWVGVWAANAAGLLAGIILTWRLVKR